MSRTVSVLFEWHLFLPVPRPSSLFDFSPNQTFSTNHGSVNSKKENQINPSFSKRQQERPYLPFPSFHLFNPFRSLCLRPSLPIRLHEQPNNLEFFVSFFYPFFFAPARIFDSFCSNLPVSNISQPELLLKSTFSLRSSVFSNQYCAQLPFPTWRLPKWTVIAS